jgi:hypothetical protein
MLARLRLLYLALQPTARGHLHLVAPFLAQVVPQIHTTSILAHHLAQPVLLARH